MRRTRRFPQRLVRWTSLCACLALILTSLAMVPVAGGNNSIALAQGRSDSPNGKGRKVRPAPPAMGAPAANLPNLDEVKGRRDPKPEAPPTIPSLMRSRRKPLESRRGKRVGDPGTTGGSVGSTGYGTPTRRGSARVSNAKDTRYSAKLAKDNPPRSSAVNSSVRSFQQGKFHHSNKSAIGRRKSSMLPPPLGDDQYVQNFYQWALLRPPTSPELTYWNDIFRTAYAHGQSSVIMAARELGKTIFESAEYAARARSDHDYVYDLYKTYLYRDPDQGGWDYWTSVVPSNGRENVRRAFDLCGELANLMGTLTPNGGITSAVSSLLAARVDPNNQPGSGLFGRPAEWSVPLLSLPGRAGLDLGLSLSYSSMVWTRSGPYLYFDEDNDFPSPGFRLGFPTIQETIFDAQVGQNGYLMIMPSGSRIELRQVGSSNTYEAADSSYLQLIDYGSSLLVRANDGTQFSYGGFNSEYRCTQIKDRNGNFISVNYDWLGHITIITDTLGRVITFNYDGNANLLSITQTWNGQTHTWATFGWGTLSMQPGFSGVSVVGTYNGEPIPVLTQVGLDDGSYFTFQYTGAGQVNLIRRYRSDNVQSSYLAYDYATTYDNCPRISQTRAWAVNWSGINGVPAEVATQFSDPGDGSHQMVAPDGTVFKEFYGTGWQKGLTTQSEVWSGGIRQKWTTTAWTQDNTSVSYQTNPRVTETNVYDSSGNRRRTTIDYGGYAQYGLPYFVREYAADGTTEIRQTFTDYNLSQAYLDRRIIGLVSEIHITNVANWQAKLSYGYDDPAKIQSQATTATQHDQSYAASFTTRGNVTSVSRWDVTDINNASKALTSQVGYDAAGSVLTTADPLGHQSAIGYTDSFSDGNNGRNTFAYPTTVADADGFSSYLQYNYDFGARTRAQGPPPAGQSQGAIQTITYDPARRLDRVTTTNTGAYTRYVYGPDYVQSFGSVNNIADESYSIGYFDGAGRVWATAGNHPGSTGGYKAQLTYYDLMGRTMKQSNPIEIYGSWAPAGDDAAGWIFTQQTYDWKGRPLVTTNTDGTQKYASYSACGCAGSEVATLTDELGRQQKVYKDVLGRVTKTEALNWDSSVYATTANFYNARDQVTLVRQYQGTDTSGVYQETAMSYDGYGRLLTKHVPEQNSGTATTYAYNSDDTVYSVTDARGATCTYGYNSRHLETSATHTLSGLSTITSSYGYDAAGNRTSMTDGAGSNSYAYDQLSRMTSETRNFTGVGGSFTLSYSYNLAGKLTSLTHPTQFGGVVSYAHDSAGRLTDVTGSGFGATTQFATGIQYRAWGAPKHVSYGTGVALNVTYNERMLPSYYALSPLYRYTYPAGYTTMGSENQYYADGRIRYARDLQDETYDRAYDYDQVARIKEAYVGREARGLPPSGNADTPYRQSYTYDVWNNMSRTGHHWTIPRSDTPTYGNNRRTDWVYNASGQITSRDGEQKLYTYDATGQETQYWEQISHSLEPWFVQRNTIDQTYDGDGQRVKRIETREVENAEGTETESNMTYYLTSSVLGGATVAEIGQYGDLTKGWVYAGGEKLAEFGPYGYVAWRHVNPVTGNWVTPYSYEGIVSGTRTELDPLGADVGATDPYTHVTSYTEIMGLQSLYEERGNPFDLGGGCAMDGLPISCSELRQRADQLFHGRLGVAEALARNSANDSNYQRRWVGPRGDGKWETTSLPLSSPWLIDWDSFPQEPAKPSHDRNAKNVPPAQPNDCLIFASMVDKLKWELYYALASPWSGGEGAFMNKLATMFTEFRSASLVSLAAQRGGYSNEGFGQYHDRGFKPEFRDPDPASDNQVRHAVGGLIAGYVLGNKPSDRRIMDAREDMNTESGRADTRLNRVTMPMGNLLRNHVGFYELGDWIRKNLCAK